MKNWASSAIEELNKNHQTKVTPRGNSMLPRIKSGESIDIRPINENTILEHNQVVLVSTSVHKTYLHKISALEGQKRFQISNNKGHVNGWVSRSAIHGVAYRGNKKV